MQVRFYGRGSEQPLRLATFNLTQGNMKTSLLSTSLATLALAFVCITPSRADVDAGDKTFVGKAAQGGMTEVAMGKLAAEKGTTQEIKDFGNKMDSEHSSVNSKLKSTAESKGITVPDKLDTMHQLAVDGLSKKSGTDFDKAYVADMVKMHQKDEAAFTKASTDLKDPDLKSLASDTLPMIKMHLSEVEKIQSGMGK